MTRRRKLKAVDLFAGAGGFSTGAMMAGIEVVWAANHWKEAVEIHAANHPGAKHACQDLHQADWSEVPEHDILLASPCCQGFTRARGANKKSVDKSRATMWAVVSCAEFHVPNFVIVENVVELLSWNLFPSWLDAMTRLGYKHTINKLNSADFGVPQSRERVFLCFTREGELELKAPRRKKVTAREIIDWDANNWQPINITYCGKPRSRAILKQIREARKIHGKDFIIAYYGNEKSGRSLDKPLGTVTTRDRFAVVCGNKMRFLNNQEVRRAMGFPDNYILPNNHRLSIHLLGNAVCPPVVKNIIEQVKKVA